MATMGWNSSVENVRAKLFANALELERLIMGTSCLPDQKLYEHVQVPDPR